MGSFVYCNVGMARWAPSGSATSRWSFADVTEGRAATFMDSGAVGQSNRKRRGDQLRNGGRKQQAVLALGTQVISEEM